jgi:hypothetical protein
MLIRMPQPFQLTRKLLLKVVALLGWQPIRHLIEQASCQGRSRLSGFSRVTHTATDAKNLVLGTRCRPTYATARTRPTVRTSNG